MVIATPLRFDSPESVALLIGELIGEVSNDVEEEFLERGERVEAWKYEEGTEECEQGGYVYA